jgi:fatty acid desaturase
MASEAYVPSSSAIKLDYSLTGVNSRLAIEKGLAEAEWYQSPVARETMRRLLERRDAPAIRDTIVWFALIFASGYAVYALWGSYWAAVPYLVYSVLYASTSDSRWHESGHGTAFRTDWLNNALYEIASFMVMRESTVWRWSHNRHHSDTIIVGRDPEIAVPRPPNLVAIIKGFFNLTCIRSTSEESSFTHSDGWPTRNARSSPRWSLGPSTCGRAFTSLSTAR